MSSRSPSPAVAVVLLHATLFGATPALGSEVAGPAPAEPTDLTWHPSWSRFSTFDFVLSGALAAGVVATYAAMPPPGANLRGGALFDDEVRGALRLSTETGRRTAGDASDVLQAVLIAQPLLLDPLLVTWGLHGDGDAAFELFFIGAQSFLLTTGVTLLTKNLTGRERPYVATCEDGSACGSAGRNRSFISGHTAAAFTGAGLLCATHGALPVYGSATADAAACGGGLLLATVTGLLRIAADDHYATDVLAGAAVGLASGYLFPALVYFSGDGEDEPELLAGGRRDPAGLRLGLLPDLGADRLGLTVLLTH